MLPSAFMVQRRWPDVVIVIAVVLLGCTGVWAIWGQELGLRGKPADPAAPPLKRVEGGGGMT